MINISTTTFTSIAIAFVVLYVVDCMFSRASQLRQRLDELRDKLVEEDRKVLRKYLLGLRATIEGLRVTIPALLGDVDEDMASEMEAINTLTSQLYEIMVKTMHASGALLALAASLPSWPEVLLYELLAFLASLAGTYASINGFASRSEVEFLMGLVLAILAVSVIAEGYRAAKRANYICEKLHDRLDSVKDLLGYRNATDAESYRLACSDTVTQCRLVSLLEQVLGHGSR